MAATLNVWLMSASCLPFAWRASGYGGTLNDMKDASVWPIPRLSAGVTDQVQAPELMAGPGAG
jgi:hypothetical protein